MSPDLIRKEDLTIQKRKSTKISSDEIRDEFTTSEKTLISNIRHAFERFSPIESIRNRLLNLTSSIDVLFVNELISSCYRSLHLFIRSIPDFQVLTFEEQTSLFQRNLFGVLFFGSLFLLRQSGLFQHSNSNEILLQLYGNESIESTKSIAEQMTSDSMTFQLLIIASIFSSNSHFLSTNFNRDSLLFGTFRLFGSQNAYVELLWKYLIEKSSNYFHAVQLYSNLIRQFLDALRLAETIYVQNRIHQTSIDKILEQNENVQQRVPLWGKD